MKKLNDLLKELGISKVKLAKYLGVSRQMIYNYLELDNINKWPKDKKVLLLNLFGIKTVEEMDKIKVDTDYITEVENRLNSSCNNQGSTISIDFGDNNSIFGNLNNKQKELLANIIDLVKEKLEQDKDRTEDGYNSMKYLHHFLQAMDNSEELKYILGYVAKETGFVKPLEFVFDEEQQFMFEAILYSAFVLYNSGEASKTKLAETHKRFVNQIEQKMEDKMSRTLELNNIKVQALKELGYTTITEDNAAEVFEKIAEIQSRKFV